MLKIAFYLDPVDRDSGALRVIPGSHRLDGDRFAQQDTGVLRDFIGGQHVWCVHSVHGNAAAVR